MSKTIEGKLREISFLITSKNTQLNINKNQKNNNNKKEHRGDKIQNKKIIKSLIHIRKYYLILILIYLINQVILNNHNFFMYLNDSFITLTIKGTGYRQMLYEKKNESYYPNEVYINGDKQDSVNYGYYFNETYNYVKLVWYSNIEDLSHMFVGCSDITEIDLSHFNTSEVTEIRGMFTDCISLTSLNLSNFNTSKVTRMFDIFKNCRALTSLDLSSFDTSNVENTQNFFLNCISLSSLDLSSFNTHNLGQCAFMFDGCINLEYINFQNFKDNRIGWCDDFFKNVPENIVICVKDENSNFIKSKLSNSNCYAIDCSIDWKSKQKKIINNENVKCIESCSDDTQYQNEYNSNCYIIVQVEFYLLMIIQKLKNVNVN